MKIWADTIDNDYIKEILPLGILFGVTTNPELLSKTSDKKLVTTLERLLGQQKGPLAVQVLSEKADEMINEGLELHSFSSRIIVKLPVNFEGIKALHALSRQGINTMATAVFEPCQALLALNAGASYIAPYFGRIMDLTDDPLKVIETIQKAIDSYFPEAKMIAAGLKDLFSINDLIRIGIDSVTLKKPLLQQLLQPNPSTQKACEDFAKAWGTPLALNLTDIRTPCHESTSQHP